jgi:hypothetical protein
VAVALSPAAGKESDQENHGECECGEPLALSVLCWHSHE